MGDKMNMMKKSVSIGFLAFACVAATTAYASSPEVVALHATFITKTNTKGQDPNLDIKIYDNQNTLIAENKGIAGDWSDNSINSISLDLKKYTLKKSDLSGGKVELDIHPGGKDKWDFNYNIATTYSDNSVVWQRWNGKELSQDKPTMSDSLTGD
jgi:hypothetical protein